MQCNICSSLLNKPIYDSNSEFSLTSLCEVCEGSTVIHACTTCGHVQTNEVHDTSAYYDSEYNILIESDDEDQIYEVKDGRKTFRTQHQVASILNKLDIPKNAKLLDYGCAKSATIRELIKSRSDINPYLFDVSEMYTTFWEKFIKPENWATYELPEKWSGNFDIVTSFFSFEHIVDVQNAILTISDLLHENGIFYCIVPNIFSNTADFVVVDHVNHFTKPSIRKMLDLANLKVIEIDDSTHRGAFIIVAQKVKDNEDSNFSQEELDKTLSEIQPVSDYWNNLADRIRAFNVENDNNAISAIYGSGFYGTYIASSLNNIDNVQCFVDQNPFRQGKQLFDKPIIAPSEMPDEVNILYVGLNPLVARSTIEDVDTFNNRQLNYFYL